MDKLPEIFTQNVTSTFGTSGVAFLAQLPTLLDECARRWKLTILPPFPNLSFNYATPVRLGDGTAAVLKLGVPRRELQTEIDTLRLYAGGGCARILDADPAIGAILLERLHPGTLLSAHPDDEEATAIAATIMRRLWRPVPAEHTIPTIEDWFGGMRELRENFGGGTGPFPTRLVEEAERLAADLFASLDPPVVLHGDLHHFNILAAEREPWLAIDPHGVIGEPAYEVGALMRNPLPAFLDFPDPLGMLERRLTILADSLGFERARLRAWTVAQGVLSAWWGYDDRRDYLDPTWIAIAEQLAALKE
ncbi:MAG TPA: aminoglycoside phosphotransferase family protein, partial [Thermomicrobiales bacterium]